EPQPILRRQAKVVQGESKTKKMKNYFCFAEPQPILRRQAKVVQGESKIKRRPSTNECTRPPLTNY
ncbi:MAG: hypothetical protein ACI3YA_05035, partial [Alloprevotella sp.]